MERLKQLRDAEKDTNESYFRLNLKNFPIENINIFEYNKNVEEKLQFDENN